MFDNVSRGKYERERDARVRAEATADALRGQVDDLKLLLQEEKRRTDDLLERLHPKAPPMAYNTLPPGQPFVIGDGPVRTPDEILRTPAVGHAGVARRQADYEAAVLRQELRRVAETRDRARADMTPEELAELDRVLPSAGQNGR